MSWFSKLFGKDDDDFNFDLPSLDFPTSTLLRWFIYDTGVGNENDLSEFLGLTRVSDEGDAKEREDSDNRLVEIKDLFPYIDYISTLSADVVASAQLRLLKKGLGPERAELKEQVEEDLKIMKEVYRAVAASSLLGAISIGIRIGVLDVGGVALTEIDLEGDIDEQ